MALLGFRSLELDVIFLWGKFFKIAPSFQENMISHRVLFNLIWMKSYDALWKPMMLYNHPSLQDPFKVSTHILYGKVWVRYSARKQSKKNKMGN